MCKIDVNYLLKTMAELPNSFLGEGMIIADLFYGLDYEILRGTEDVNIKSISCDSRKCTYGCVFFALEGRDTDGYRYISEAVEKGACAVVLDKALQKAGARRCEILRNSASVTVVAVKDARMALAVAGKNFFGRPDEEMAIIGVTGTKGKTTTTHMIFELLREAGYKVGIIGTLGSKYGDYKRDFPNTTPESYEIYEELRKMADGGCTAVMMEVSSQGLKYHRVEGIHFKIAVLTNIYVDHIGRGEHESFRDYAQSKKKIFDKCSLAVVNSDDVLSQYMVSGMERNRISTFGMKADADFTAKDVKYTELKGRPGAEYICKHGDAETPVKMSLPGSFNVLNSLAAITVCSLLGADFVKCCNSVGSVKVRGRLEPVEVDGFPSDYKVFVDYAHNGASLKALLKVLRCYTKNRLVAVFGCGGQRDARRRVDMGQAAAQLADLSVITSDNPRCEKPMDIINDIIRIIEECGGKYIAIDKRREAIRWALANAKKGDIIVVAGKGHETYQIIGDEIIHFDDREEILDFIKQQIADNVQQRAGCVMREGRGR